MIDTGACGRIGFDREARLDIEIAARERGFMFGPDIDAQMLADVRYDGCQFTQRDVHKTRGSLDCPKCR